MQRKPFRAIIYPTAFSQKLPKPLRRGDFANAHLPVHLDIGCARGNFVMQLAAAQRKAPAWNFVGLEIREQLVREANASIDPTEGCLRYVKGNILVPGTVATLLGSATPGDPSPDTTPADSALSSLELRRVSIQFPSPWKKACHRRRRMLQPELLKELAAIMPVGGEIFFSSDVREIAQEMRANLLTSPHFAPSHTFEADDEGWLLINPLGAPSERELVCEETGRPVYRGAYVRR